MAYILGTLLACQKGMCRRSDGTYPYDSKHAAYDGFIDILLTASSEFTLTLLGPNLITDPYSLWPSPRLVATNGYKETRFEKNERSNDGLGCGRGVATKQEKIISVQKRPKKYIIREQDVEANEGTC
ncbi:hypothetical protein Z517_09282 [Fonsecaea pedrosoi CBS 271.37]|uniref:Uncharacterized protein n=1 Tax=Fonsecaea pedrosoi CBS 271.37 TaxID=1442368 RepID=A0A0D2G822_9EURO|nr:uncharacterized protein Z517_09282 [Fonsecaea pedrosoi CBS 271.37]KIW76838.1 hypothetical protein Z517_09282 [Fonsecaea pedrosoi CBS 271.37]